MSSKANPDPRQASPPISTGEPQPPSTPPTTTMNSFTYPLLRVLPRQLKPTSPLTFLRHESTSRRLTKKLRLPPHESMRLTAASPSQNHIIYNPPSASPSVYVTPSLFLPKDDPRRTLFASTNTVAGTEKKGKEKLPPALKKPYKKKYHLTEADFAEIRELRTSDPNKWTRRKLAEKFNTSSLFIGMVCQASEDRKSEMQERLAIIKQRWGIRKRTARLERARGRAGWGGADGL